MIRSMVCIGSMLLSSFGLFGQDIARPEFEVADIKLNKSGETQVSGGALPGGQLSIRNITLRALLQIAFQSNYIVEGPRWFDSDRFDIVAKAPAGAPEDQLPPMLQTFLSQEFKLAVHREPRPLDVYVLVVGKGGPKLQKAAGSGPPDCRRALHAQAAEKGAARLFVEGTFEAVCTNVTIADLGRHLQRLAPGYVNREVVDQTGIQGTYDLTLDWAPATLIDQGGLTMFDAVDKMLGLKLEPRKLPMTVVVIDHIEKLPNN